jgi:glycosyltransferase involved in cell wall biosynthesis
MIVKNISTEAIQLSVAGNRLTIMPGETKKDIPSNLIEILQNSHFKNQVEYLDKIQEYEEVSIVVKDTEKINVDFRMPIRIGYKYDGYGRLGQQFQDSLEFNENSNTVVLIGKPGNFIRKYNDKNVIYFTMFEADKIPDSWVKYLNESDGVIVPTTWVKKVFRDCGVKVKIKIVPLGVDNFYVTRPETDNTPFVFMHQNSFVCGDQKGWRLVLNAFVDVFGDDPGVKLILKGREHRWANDMEAIPQQSNIEVITKELSRNELDEMMNNVHCFVFPSRGEGFGLPPVECMARGIPTILTDAHSMHDFAHLGIGIGITKKKFPVHYEGRVAELVTGDWVTPDIEELKKKMYDVFVKYNQYKEQAIINRSKVIEAYKESDMFENFIKAVDELKHEK